MSKVLQAYMKGKITRIQMHRYQELHKKLIGTDSFVEIGNSKDWEEFINLSNKI